MNSSLIRLAGAVSKKPLRIKEELLPSIVLYRRLLRIHRKVLPNEMRLMGDDYVKAEFRRTRKTDNPLHLVGFLSEWNKYLKFHEQQFISQQTAHLNSFSTTGEQPEEGVVLAEMEAAKERVREGRKLEEGLFEKLSADQLGQLYELLKATKEIYGDPVPEEGAQGIPAGSVLPDLGQKKE